MTWYQVSIPNPEFYLWTLLFFESEPHYVAQACLKLEVLLLHPLEFWEYMDESPYLASFWNFLTPIWCCSKNSSVWSLWILNFQMMDFSILKNSKIQVTSWSRDVKRNVVNREQQPNKATYHTCRSQQNIPVRSERRRKILWTPSSFFT